MRIQCISENSLMLYLGDTIDQSVALKVRAAVDLIQQNLSACTLDIIPSYNSIHLTYNLMRTDHLSLCARLRELLADVDNHSFDNEGSTVIEIPVYYGAEVALDMDEICQHTGLARDEIVRIHSTQIYTVYAIGFSPGFAYLGNTDSQIAMPRKRSPRIRVPAGSLGIADTQTAIYPSDSPGGWNILGRTPMNLVDFDKPTLTPFNMGDQVRFVAIDQREYLRQGGVL